MTAAPTGTGTRPEPGPGHDRGLPGLEGGVVEGPRAPEPDRVALDRERRAEPVAPAARSRPSATTRVSVPSAPGSPATACVASSPSTASISRSVTTRPRSQAVAHHASRAEAGSRAVTAARYA